jgi:hypothetical protein
METLLLQKIYRSANNSAHSLDNVQQQEIIELRDGITDVLRQLDDHLRFVDDCLNKLETLPTGSSGQNQSGWRQYLPGHSSLPALSIDRDWLHGLQTSFEDDLRSNDEWLLSLIDPHVNFPSETAIQRSRMILDALRQKHILDVMRLLTENDVKKLVMRTCLSADRLSEKWGSHLMDLTKAAASHLSPEDENIVDLFNSDPETQGALARVQNALLNPHLGSNAGLIVSSDRQKRPPSFVFGSPGGARDVSFEV